MDKITKIDDTTIEIVTPQPDKVERTTLDWLKIQKDSLVNQRDTINEQIDDLNVKIDEARRLGAKTREEVISTMQIDEKLL
jgi:hypothetical protein